MTDTIIRIHTNQGVYGREGVWRADLSDAGGKFRDKIRCYADTTESDDPTIDIR